MIASFRSKALERFWVRNETRHVDPRHVKKIAIILSALDSAVAAQDLNLQGWGFHQLTGDQAGRYAVKVDKNWRITFGWSAPDAVDVDYEDYH